MAFLPFYIPKQKQLRIVIIGGGYAGMAAMTTLYRYAPDCKITLIDEKDHHTKITHLHETFRYPLSDLQVSFSDLSKRFGFRFIQTCFKVDKNNLQQWQADKQLVLNDEIISFDYLLITTGCGSEYIDKSIEGTLNLQNFTNISGADLLCEKLVHIQNDVKPVISVVGGGATGIQFLFEIRQFLFRKKINAKLRLIHSRAHVLEQFPAGFHTYVIARLNDSDVEFYPNTYYSGQADGEIILQDKLTKNEFKLHSDLSLLFLGNKSKQTFEANCFGQIEINAKPLKNIFVAGDCSHFNSLGSNSLSAQSAVRKGKLVARNMLRQASVLNFLEPYLHQDLGYVVSLGHADAVGWLAAEGNVITGLPALTIKEIVESQYDLLLMGIDTYLV